MKNIFIFFKSTNKMQIKKCRLMEIWKENMKCFHFFKRWRRDKKRKVMKFLWWEQSTSAESCPYSNNFQMCYMWTTEWFSFIIFISHKVAFELNRSDLYYMRVSEFEKKKRLESEKSWMFEKIYCFPLRTSCSSFFFIVLITIIYWEMSCNL